MYQPQAFPIEGPAIEWEIGPEIVSERYSRVMIPSGPSIYATCNHPLSRDVKRVKVDFMVVTGYFEVQHECEQVLNRRHAFMPDVRPNSIVCCAPHLAPIVPA